MNPRALAYLFVLVLGLILGSQITVVPLPDDTSYQSVLTHCLEYTDAITDTEVEICAAIAHACSN